MPELNELQDKSTPSIPPSFWGRNASFITMLVIVILPLSAYGINRLLVEYEDLKGARELMGKIHDWFKDDLEVRASTLSITAVVLPCIGIYVDIKRVKPPEEKKVEEEDRNEEVIAPQVLNPPENRGAPIHVYQIRDFHVGELLKEKIIQEEIKKMFNLIEKHFSRLSGINHQFTPEEKQQISEKIFADLKDGICVGYAGFWMRWIERVIIESQSDHQQIEDELKRLDAENVFNDVLRLHIGSTILTMMNIQLKEKRQLEHKELTALIQLDFPFSSNYRVFLSGKTTVNVEECEQSILSSDPDQELHFFIDAWPEAKGRGGHRMFIYSKGNQHYFSNNYRLYSFSSREDLNTYVLELIKRYQWIKKITFSKRLSEEHRAEYGEEGYEQLKAFDDQLKSL